MKFPPCTEKNFSEIIKIEKLHEKGLIVTLFKLFTDIFIQNSMIKSHSSTGASLMYMLPIQKHYKFIKKLAVDGSMGWTMPMDCKVGRLKRQSGCKGTISAWYQIRDH